MHELQVDCELRMGAVSRNVETSAAQTRPNASWTTYWDIRDHLIRYFSTSRVWCLEVSVAAQIRLDFFMSCPKGLETRTIVDWSPGLNPYFWHVCYK